MRRSASTIRLIKQYWDYLSSVIRLDFGTTFSDNQPVLQVVRDNGGATLTLTVAAFLLALLVGIPLGLLAGRYRDSVPDVVIRLFGILTYAAPVFFVGYLLQVYVAQPLGLPTSGHGQPDHRLHGRAQDPHPADRRLPQRRRRRDRGRPAST